MASQNVPCTTDNLVIGTYSLCLNGVDLGATTGGVTITQENEYVEIRNDQTCTLQAVYKTQEDFMIKTTMRDVGLDKLRVLYGLTPDETNENNPDESLCLESNVNGCQFPEEFELVICGPGPGCGCRNFFFPRVVIVPSTVDYTIQKDNPVEIEVEFKALASCPSGLIGSITDICEEVQLNCVGFEELQTFTCADDVVPPFEGT